MKKNKCSEFDIFAEQIRILYRLSKRALIVSFMSACLFVFILWDMIAPADLFLWWGFLCLSIAERAYHTFQVVHRDDYTHVNRLVLNFQARVLVHAIIWGNGLVLFFPDVPIKTQILLVVFITGLSAGALASLVSNMRAFVVFVLPVTLPTILWSFSQDDVHYNLLGILVSIYVSMLCIISWDLYKIIREKIVVQQQNKLLLEALESDNKHLLRENEGLHHQQTTLLSASLTDPLTGISNRRALEKHLSEYWQSSLENGMQISVLLVDIDFFKQYNDFYGHQAGDKCLQSVVNLISASLKRKTDLFARYGGEEFVIVMPSANSGVAKKQAEAARLAVEKANIEHCKSHLSFVSISIGLISANAISASSTEELIEMADANLYKAKQTGRNRVIS